MTKLPYLAAPGVIPKIFGKIQEARRPERFTQDFLETKLGASGGSARAIIPLLKRMGFLSSDGSPTNLYDQFRNPSTQGEALAAGIRNAYRESFDRNDFADNLSREKLTNLVREMTGLEKDSRVVQLIVSTFWTLKADADFEGQTTDEGSTAVLTVVRDSERKESEEGSNAAAADDRYERPVDFRVGYTINLNLPETTNVEVFNAIFRSLKEHLLRS
jgi:hypothetical protein